MTSPRIAGPVAWHAADAVRCAVATIPAAVVVTFGDVQIGLGLAVGVLPAALVGMAATRRKRRNTLTFGLLCGVFVVLGSLLSQNAAVAVVGMFALALGSAVLAAKRPFGLVALSLCLPITAVGLSFTDVRSGLAAGGVLVLGSVVAFAVNLFWPEQQEPPTRAPAMMSLGPAWRYGLSLALTASTATLIGLLIGTDHLGWAPAAALFVIRPQAELQQLRSVGRIVSVVVGALLAVVVTHLGPPHVVLAVLLLAALAGAAGTRGSRWYVTPVFSTYIVISLLLVGTDDAATSEWRFWERVGLTAVGVGLAYLFALVLPRLWQRIRREHPESPSDGEETSPPNRQAAGVDDPAAEE